MPREPMRASDQDGSYPRPQLVRGDWCDLGGAWDFAHDDDDAGQDGRWWAPGATFDRTITVPFPPESPASGIGDTGYHPVVWYRREISWPDILSSGFQPGRRLLLHFGAVDYRAAIWAGGELVGTHEGGQSPFSLDVTGAVRADEPLTLVVRAEDDPLDVSQPRGKQDWLPEPHVIWYHRTTGIWQPVWLESVPPLHVRSLGWSCDLPAGAVDLQLELSRRPSEPVEVTVRLEADGDALATVTVTVDEPRASVRIDIPALHNGQGYESMLWSPEQPRLVDAHISVADDEVSSYLGLRSVGVSGDAFLLNDRPVFVRSVLEQGYWPQSHLAAPSAEALRAEVQLIKDLGFNAARLHEKAEDPRLLYWADRLGLMVWGELGSAFEYSSTAATRTAREWADIVLRDRSHPCIVTWVPLNESWGVQHIAHDPAQLAFARALLQLTKALDPTRPVISNDGWEHAESDMLTVHDYATTGDALWRSYADGESVQRLAEGMGPAGRRMSVAAPLIGVPVMVTEFGGVTYAPDSDIDTWGYSVASDAADYQDRLQALFDALNASPVLAGFCYTQLTDTRQEANGLTDEHRVPKLPAETIAAIVRGTALS